MSELTVSSPSPSIHTAAEPETGDLRACLDDLCAYRERLTADVVAMGQRLKLPARQVNQTLEQHPELQRIAAVISQLEQQIEPA